MEREIAKRLVKQLQRALDEMNEALFIANNSEVGGLRTKCHTLFATVVADVDLELLEPIYKQFPDLRPEGLDEVHDS